jgi:hypothetical protein
VLYCSKVGNKAIAFGVQGSKSLLSGEFSGNRISVKISKEGQFF